MSPWLTRATRGPPPERLRWLVLPSLREVFPVPMAGLLGVLVPRGRAAATGRQLRDGQDPSAALLSKVQHLEA